jgi:hypothetical protein
MTHTAIPDPDQRAALNVVQHATGADSGFWDHDGRPAPWPDDIDEWKPATNKPTITDHDEQPF